MKTAPPHRVATVVPRIDENGADRIRNTSSSRPSSGTKFFTKTTSRISKSTEEQLGKEYNISRITVREAVDRLVQERLLERRQGKGTDVSRPRSCNATSPSSYSFSHDIAHLGLKPSSTALECRIVEASPEEAARLRLAENSSVTRIRRVRMANENPILLETTAIPVYLCPRLSEADLEHGSLY